MPERRSRIPFAKAVRVTVPARVAYRLPEIQKVTAEVLGRLGCPECHSGFDIRFDAVSQFVVDEQLNVNELGR